MEFSLFRSKPWRIKQVIQHGGCCRQLLGGMAPQRSCRTVGIGETGSLPTLPDLCFPLVSHPTGAQPPAFQDVSSVPLVASRSQIPYPWDSGWVGCWPREKGKKKQREEAQLCPLVEVGSQVGKGGLSVPVMNLKLNSKKKDF